MPCDLFPTTMPKSDGSKRFRTSAKLALELLEHRIVPAWGEVPPATIVPPTNATAVVLNHASSAQGNGNIFWGENDFYKFTAKATGTYRFSATPFGRFRDTVLAVYSSSGFRIAYNDDISNTNHASQATVRLKAGVKYFLGITSFAGSRSGSYTWQISGPVTSSSAKDDIYEENDTRASAFDLGILTSTRTVSNLRMADASDWFQFTTSVAGTSSSSVRIVHQNNQGNLNLELYQANGQRIGTSATFSNTETVSLAGKAAGTYYVRVYGNNGVANPNYTLTVSAPTPPTPPAGAFDIVARYTGLTTSQRQLFQQAIARWEQIIVGDVPNATYRGIAVDDLLIDVSSRSIDGFSGTLGEAGADAFRSGSQLPYHGSIEFDSADLASMEASGQLLSVMIHEIGHVLGFGTIWESRGLLVGAGTTNPRFVGAQAVAAYNALFGASGTSVPVEGWPSPAGSRDSHWRESVFGNEILSPYLARTRNPISRVTIASFADLGYKVNLNAADAFSP